MCLIKHVYTYCLRRWKDPWYPKLNGVAIAVGVVWQTLNHITTDKNGLKCTVNDKFDLR